MKQQCLESAFRRTRQRLPEGAAIQSRHRQSKLCQRRTVSRCDLYNDGFLPAPWLAPFSLLFNNRFCRVWLADAWHIVMSRKGTCIFTHFPFFVAEKGKPKRERLWNLPDLNRFRKPTHWSGKTSGLTGALPTSACWIHGKSPLCLDIGGY